MTRPERVLRDTPIHEGFVKQTNTPVVALATVALLLVSVVALILTGHFDEGGDALLALTLSTLPSIFASLYAERTARDVRNGVIAAQAKLGSRKALDETGVTEAVQRGDESTMLAMNALRELLVHVQIEDPEQRRKAQHRKAQDDER